MPLNTFCKIISDFDPNDDFFGEREQPEKSEFASPFSRKKPRFFATTDRDHARAEFDYSEPKSFYNFSHDLLPDLETVARPKNWNVHDFGSWEEYRARNYEAAKILKENPNIFEAFLTLGNAHCGLPTQGFNFEIR